MHEHLYARRASRVAWRRGRHGEAWRRRRPEWCGPEQSRCRRACPVTFDELEQEVATLQHLAGEYFGLTRKHERLRVRREAGRSPCSISAVVAIYGHQMPGSAVSRRQF